MNNYDLNWKPHVYQNSFVEHLDNAILILHPYKPSWMELNKTGLFLFKNADASKSVSDIAHILAQKYETTFENVVQDVLAFFTGLKKTDFLVEQNKSDSSLQADKINYHLFMHLNQDCNLSCAHCYTKSNPNYSWHPSFEAISKILQQAREANVTMLTISGGEPLLYPQLKDVLLQAIESFDVRLLTNGTLINKEKAEFLAKATNSVQFSLDGSFAQIHDKIRGKGSFAKTMNSIHLMQDLGFNENLVICTTVTKNNIDDIPSLIALAEKEGIPLIRFLPLMLQGRAVTQLQRLLPTDDELITLYENLLPYIVNVNSKTTVSGYISGLLMKPLPGHASQQWCPVGRTLVMDFDGTVSPCILMNDKNWNLGNLFKQSSGEIIKQGQLKKIGDIILKRREKIEKCRNCPWKHFCQAGCAGIALQQKETLMEVDRFCDYRKELYPRLFSNLIKQRRELALQRRKINT